MTFRTIRGISQNVLGELAGIDGTTIRKYELGSRKPKPDQLLKIANALSVSINVFTDFDIETASDVLSLLFKMDEQVDMEIDGEKDIDGNLIPDTICIRFKHPEINSRLAKFAKAKKLQTNLITSKDCPSFGGVYKLAAIQKEMENFIPRLNFLRTQKRLQNPGNKTVYRIYDKATGKMRADLICFADETYDTDEDLLLFDPTATWKKTKFAGGSYTMREILKPVFINGACVYDSPSVMEIAAYCAEEKKTLWDETKRLFNPHKVYVDLSRKLYDEKQALLNQMSIAD